MAYQLDLALDTADALRQVAAEQLQDATERLQSPEDPVTAVHEARKDLKKVRSLLRLGRPKGRRRINAELRAIAASLAGARDADVMVATVEDLRGRYAGQLPARTFGVIARRFATAAAATTIDDATVVALDAQRLAVDGWRFGEVDLVANCARAYARGRAERKAARRDPSVEQLHEWRKRVKDLWYHARLLEAAWPGVLRALAEEAHALSDRLGDDHDLGVLMERFAAQAWPPSVDAEAFLDLCQHRREALQAAAFALGTRLYAEPPDAFARRIGAYLAA